MEEKELKLINLYNQCIKELKDIGINIQDENVGKIDIKIAKRNNKRYGCCKQELPDEKSKFIQRIGYRRIIRYEKFKSHHIEISKWVMELDNEIIKNTIMHEIIHCLPYCNNHGKEFKKYAKYINQKLGYDIARVGNKKEDFEKSNIEYKENKNYNYKITCKKCGQVFYRQRYNKNLVRRYRCGICNGKLEVIKL